MVYDSTQRGVPTFAAHPFCIYRFVLSVDYQSMVYSFTLNSPSYSSS